LAPSGSEGRSFSSGYHLTEESKKQFLRVWFCAIVGDAQRNFHHRYTGGSGALAVDHPGSQQPTEARLGERRIIVLTADGAGTTAVMRAVGKGKTVVWRWQGALHA